MLSLSHITRRFGATLAVDDVSLAIERGEIVGLVGENGAGKSTLMRIAAGEIKPDSGTVHIDGAIGFVHQHFAIVSHFTIAENLALAHERGFRVASRRAREEEARHTIERTGIQLSGVSRIAGELSVGEKSKLELIKAIATNPRLLILDEPTSVLTPIETTELFGVMRRLASSGTAVVFISHKVPEVMEIAGRIVVMRGGRIVSDHPSAGMTGEDVARAMVDVNIGPANAGLANVGSASAGPSDPQSEGRLKPALRHDRLQVEHGEIVAIVGVAGNGQTELVQTLRATHDGAFIPEDRSRDALIAEMTIAENIALGSTRWNQREAERRAADLIARYNIRARNAQQPAGELSGGNQQKVVLARELSRDPELIVAAEPTRGLDVEATRYVHERLREASANGAGVLLITSDLDEAFALADRVHVIYRRTLSEAMTPAVASQRVASLMAGVA